MTKTLIPRRPWFTFAAGGILAFLIVLLLAALSLLLTGCGSEGPTKTWPEVAGKIVEGAGTVVCVYLLTRTSSRLRGAP